MGAIWDGFGQACQGMLPLFVLYLGALSVINGHTGVGTVFTELSLAIGLLTPLTSVARTAHQFRVASAYWNRVSDLVLTEAERTGSEPIDVDGHIELCDVTFSYAGEPVPALKNVSCTFERGQTTAIVGVSGSGKSTLVSVLLGLFTPQSGKVLAGGKPIAEGNLQAFRQGIGVVLQDETIFEGTIFSNIALGCSTATLEDVVSAARAANLHGEISKMPAGYETYVGEDGRNLSGGQRQRLALARALIRRPKLLILDEAVSNLDENNCAQVEMSVRALTCTRVVITHRLSLIKDADKILVMDGGSLVETGKHANLLKARNMYWALWDSQMSSQDPQGPPGVLAGTSREAGSVRLC
jgi:ATP-binding cassette subfamily B protein